jgi:hypothetical protein
VADNPGGGTRFHFTLPLATALDRALAARAGIEAATVELPAGPAGRLTPHGAE